MGASGRAAIARTSEEGQGPLCGTGGGRSCLGKQGACSSADPTGRTAVISVYFLFTAL